MFRNIFKRVLAAIMGIYSILTIYPIIWLLLNSFKKTEDIVTGDSFGIPRNLEIANYTKALFEHNILRSLLNSIIVTGVTIVFTLTVSIMLAYALARMKWKGSQALYTYIAIGLLVPSQAIIIPIFIIIKKMHLIDNQLSLIFTGVAFNIAISMIVAYGFLRKIPAEMEEAAIIDGCGLFGIIGRIFVPIIKPAIAAICINIFINSWNEFIFAMLFISKTELKTLPIGLMSFIGQYGINWGAMFAAMMIASFIPIILFIIFSNQIEKAVTAGAVLK